MRHLKAVSVAGASVLAAAIPFVGLSAQADSEPQANRLLISIDERPRLQANGDVVVTGTLRCPAGTTFLLTANVRQGTEFHGEFTGGTCTGADQRWSVSVFGGAYRTGAARAGAIFQPDAADTVETYNEVRIVQ